MTPIQALKDNYIWLFAHQDQACVVDPGDAKPVLDYLNQHKLQLNSILLTHHHHDHSDGIAELRKAFPNITVYGSHHSHIPDINHKVQSGDIISVLNQSFRVLEIPGHTLDHTAFYNDQILFSGDTLFSAGCGRVFEGTYEQMYASLMKLMSLSDAIQLFCGHEYTLANLHFAQQVEPDNADIATKISEVKLMLEKNGCSLPSSLGEEKKFNPFLRCQVPSIVHAVQQHSGKSFSHPVEVFQCLREWKNKL